MIYFTSDLHFNHKNICSYSKGKKYYIGSFLDKLEAAKAYDIKVKELHGEFAVLNFPEETRKFVER